MHGYRENPGLDSTYIISRKKLMSNVIEKDKQIDTWTQKMKEAGEVF